VRLFGRVFALGDVEDVEGTACGWFQDRVLTWVVRYMVAVDDVVVPVSLTRLKQALLEFKGTLPCT